MGAFGGDGYANGLFDMIGNVPEWTADRFLPYPGQKLFDVREVRGSPLMPHAPEALVSPDWSREDRVIRGGPWFGTDELKTTSRSAWTAGDHTYYRIGLRGVRSVEPEAGGGADGVHFPELALRDVISGGPSPLALA